MPQPSLRLTNMLCFSALVLISALPMSHALAQAQPGFDGGLGVAPQDDMGGNDGPATPEPRPGEGGFLGSGGDGGATEDEPSTDTPVGVVLDLGFDGEPVPQSDGPGLSPDDVVLPDVLASTGGIVTEQPSAPIASKFMDVLQQSNSAGEGTGHCLKREKKRGRCK